MPAVGLRDSNLMSSLHARIARTSHHFHQPLSEGIWQELASRKSAYGAIPLIRPTSTPSATPTGKGPGKGNQNGNGNGNGHGKNH